MPSGAGRVVAGRYELIERIGAGGMGTVWLAQQLGVGNRVAVKFLAPQFIADPKIAERFLREGRVGVEVTHPGAAQLIDMGRDDDELYLVFEYVAGENLSERIARVGAMPLDAARDIVIRVAEVLAFAHDHGIVHRDVKPDNIRVLDDLAGTHVKVLDFGIARWATSDVNLTAEGAMAGTPRYMSPEQVRGEAVDGRADQYALGLILFELVTGRPAFESKNVSQLLLHQLQTPVPSVGPIELGAQLDALIARACAKSPQARFAHITEFVNALKAIQPPGRQGRLVPASGLPHQDVTAGARPALTRELATLYPGGQVPPVREELKETDFGQHGLGVIVVLVMLVVAGLGAAIHSMLTDSPAPPAPPSAEACPSLHLYDPALTSLSTAALEDRVRHSRVLPAAAADRQLQTIQASREQYAPAQRDCLYRTSLVAMVANEKTTLATSPELWGEQFSVDELTLQFLELPMKRARTVPERKAVMQRIDQLFVTPLAKDHPDDELHWRRMYLGIFLLCEVTDSALETLKTRRPQNCLSIPETP